MLGFTDGLAFNPRNPDRLYAIVNARTLVRTTDAGKTFAAVASFDKDILDAVLVSALEDLTVYVAYGGLGDPNPAGTWKSGDDGATWTRHPFGASAALIGWSIGQDAITGALYVGTEIADHPQPYRPPFFTSPDRGSTWLDATNGLAWHVTGIFVNNDDHSVLALTEGMGLYKSSNAARSWELLNTVFATSLGVDARDPARLFVGAVVLGAHTGGAFASYDGGKTFFASGLDRVNVSGFAFNGTSTRLYAACFGAGIYVTDIEPPER